MSSKAPYPVGIEDIYCYAEHDSASSTQAVEKTFVSGQLFYPAKPGSHQGHYPAFLLPGSSENRQHILNRICDYSLKYYPNSQQTKTLGQTLLSPCLKLWLQSLASKKIQSYPSLPFAFEHNYGPPLCLVSVGKRSMTWWHTQLAECLASHGFSTLIIQHTHDAIITLDSRLRSYDFHPDPTTENLRHAPLSPSTIQDIHNQVLAKRVRDVNLVLSQLPSHRLFTQYHLEAKPPIMLGHSRGGSTVYEWVGQGHRCSGLVLMDPALACSYTPWKPNQDLRPCLLFTLPKYWEHYYKTHKLWHSNESPSQVYNDDIHQLCKPYQYHPSLLDKRILKNICHEDFTDAPNLLLGPFAKLLGLSSTVKTKTLTQTLNHQVLYRLQHHFGTYHPHYPRP